MRNVIKSFVEFFVSLKLTVVLLALSALMVFFATLDQTQLGVWGIQHKWFQSLIVLQNIKGLPIPIFPGGYFLGGLLLINLVSAHIYRFKLSWKKSGIFITHAGLIVLLVGELLSGVVQRESTMKLDEGDTKNYSESTHYNELAIIDATDPEFDNVVAIPDALLTNDASLQYAKLPFRVVVKAFYPNAFLQMRNQVPNAPDSLATMGVGTQVVATPMPLTYKENEANEPAAFIELIGREGPLGTYLVSTQLRPQSFELEGKKWQLVFRPERYYTHYTVTLEKFSHDRYAGTDIAKNFSSKVRLQTDDGHTDREVLIYMNNPLRFDGLTYYQASFDPSNEHNTVLQVVKNPSWILPYVACAMLFTGLIIQFGISLIAFASKRRRQNAHA